MKGLLNNIDNKYHDLLPNEDIIQGVDRIRNMTSLDIAKQESNDISANYVSLGCKSVIE